MGKNAEYAAQYAEEAKEQMRMYAYADGTYVKTYVHADKMPESAKEGIAKNVPADSFSY